MAKSVFSEFERGPEHQCHLGSCKKYRFSGLTPDLLNQKLGGRV